MIINADANELNNFCKKVEFMNLYLQETDRFNSIRLKTLSQEVTEIKN